MHVPRLTGLAVSHDSALLVSISHDKSVKVFDVASFDMMAMLRLPFVPACAEWISKARSPPAMHVGWWSNATASSRLVLGVQV